MGVVEQRSGRYRARYRDPLGRQRSETFTPKADAERFLPPEVVFVMKLYRADPQHREDMLLLWPMCRSASPEDAVEAFEAAYPHAPEDEHLVEFVREIAQDASIG